MSAAPITITSWNVNGIRARAERLTALIERSSPDVLLLQETKCDPDQVPAEIFTSHGYQWAAIGAAGRNGVDFNVAPSDADVWDPAALAGATHVSPEERSAFEAIVNCGLTDTALALTAPGEHPAFTWWDYRGGAFHRGHGMRIDHLLASPSAGRVLSFAVDRNERKGALPSDHAPITLTIEAQ